MQTFNYHSHTYRCGHADLDFTDEEYILEYIKMGFKKIAVTDHCPQKNGIDNNENSRMKYSQKDEYLDSIKKLKEKYADKIEIQVGYEVEYLPGEEDNIKELKLETDKIILGQHFIYDKNKENLKNMWEDYFEDEDLIRYAEYISKAIEYNIPDIIAHPDLFMRKRKKFGEVEKEVANIICKAAEKYDIPLEINLNGIYKPVYFKGKNLENLSKVVYPCKEFWEVVSNYNIEVLYGLDTHYRGQILLWNELIELSHKILGKELIKKLNFIK